MHKMMRHYTAEGRGSGPVNPICNHCGSKEITSRSGKYYLCEGCAKTLHEEMGRTVTKISASTLTKIKERQVEYLKYKEETDKMISADNRINCE